VFFGVVFWVRFLSQALMRRSQKRFKGYRDYVPRGTVVLEDFYVVRTGFGKEEVCREYDVRPPYVVCVTFDGRVITVRDPSVKAVVVSQD
jgi:hypothetical protein